MNDRIKKNLETLIELIAIALVAYAIQANFNYMNSYHSETRAFNNGYYRCDYYLEYKGGNLIGVTLLNCIDITNNFKGA